jgi:hypothetical protein
MPFQNDRPFRDVEKVMVAAEFLSAAERLMIDDVRPEILSERDRATVQYYLQCLSKKFFGLDEHR